MMGGSATPLPADVAAEWWPRSRRAIVRVLLVHRAEFIGLRPSSMEKTQRMLNVKRSLYMYRQKESTTPTADGERYRESSAAISVLGLVLRDYKQVRCTQQLCNRISFPKKKKVPLLLKELTIYRLTGNISKNNSTQWNIRRTHVQYAHSIIEKGSAIGP